MKKTDKQLNSKNGRKKAKLTPVPKAKYKKFKTNFDDEEDDFNFKSRKYQKNIDDEDFDLEEDFDEEYDDEDMSQDAKKRQKRRKETELENDFDEEDNF